MKKILFSLLAFAIIAYFAFNYLMASPKDIKTSTADFNIETSAFSKEFVSDLATAEKKYTDKVISLKGKITEVEKNGITIDKTVYCKLDNTSTLKVGNTVSVKGKFIGYDDLFELIKLDQGSILK